MVHGILQFTPSIAFRYVLHRCESRDIRCESRFDIRETSPPPVHPADGATVRRTLRSVFLGACRAGGFVSPHVERVRARRRGGDRTGAFAPRAGPDFICNVFAVCFCRFRQ
ncbi:UNVERIFIED_CONTAM: hypothetical protein Sindi_3110600 [Sesamum indicum]